MFKRMLYSLAVVSLALVGQSTAPSPQNLSFAIGEPGPNPVLEPARALTSRGK